MTSHALRQAHYQPAVSLTARVREWGPEILVGVAALVALGLGIWQLDRRPFWLDEATTYYVSGVRWTRLLELLSTGGEGWHPPTYFLALKLWRVFGDSQVALRSFSLLFAVLTIPAVYLVARRLLESRWVAAVAALLMACNAFFVHYAQEARTYSLTLFLTIISFWLFLRALESRSLGRWLAYAAVSLLGIYSHVFFALLVVAQGVALALPRMRPASWRNPVVAFGAVGLLTVPLVLASLGDAGGLANWIDPITLSGIWELVVELAGSTPAGVVAYLLAAGIAIGWAVSSGGRPHWLWVLLLWALVPTFGLAAASLVKPLFVVRYLIIVLPALVILVAVGISRFPAPISVLLVAVVLVASGLGLEKWYSGFYKPWDRLATFLENHGELDDGIAIWRDQPKPLAYQALRLTDLSSMPRLAAPAWRWTFNPYSRVASLDKQVAKDFAACRFERIWLVDGPERLPRSVAGDRKQTIAGVLRSGYDAGRTYRRARIEIQLFERNDQPCAT